MFLHSRARARTRTRTRTSPRPCPHQGQARSQTQEGLSGALVSVTLPPTFVLYYCMLCYNRESCLYLILVLVVIFCGHYLLFILWHLPHCLSTILIFNHGTFCLPFSFYFPNHVLLCEVLCGCVIPVSMLLGGTDKLTCL